MKKLILFGGSFNPPHVGHVQAALSAAEAVRPDWIMWMPAKSPPHKDIPVDSPTDDQRMDMSKLATEGIDIVHISGLEMYGDMCYSIDTITGIKESFPDTELWMLVGSDMFLSLDTWHRAQDIFLSAQIITVPRSERERIELHNKAEEYGKRFNSLCLIAEHTIVDISSTQIRGLLKQGKGGEYLPPKVFEYITENGLYGIGSDGE